MGNLASILANALGSGLLACNENKLTGNTLNCICCSGARNSPSGKDWNAGEGEYQLTKIKELQQWSKNMVYFNCLNDGTIMFQPRAPELFPRGTSLGWLCQFMDHNSLVIQPEIQKVCFEDFETYLLVETHKARRTEDIQSHGVFILLPKKVWNKLDFI